MGKTDCSLVLAQAQMMIGIALAMKAKHHIASLSHHLSGALIWNT